MRGRKGVERGGVGGGGALSMPTVVRRRILSVFCCRKAAAKASSPCLQGEPRGALSWRGGRLHQVPLSSRAVSLPQSFCALWARKSSLAPSPLTARASAVRSCTCGRQRLTYLLTLYTYRCADLTAFSALFRIPISALFCPRFPPFPRVLLKKFRFNVNFLPRYAKNYCKKGKNHLLFRV